MVEIRGGGVQADSKGPTFYMVKIQTQINTLKGLYMFTKSDIRAQIQGGEGSGEILPKSHIFLSHPQKNQFSPQHHNKFSS